MKGEKNTISLEMPKLIKVARTQCENSGNLEEIAKKAAALYSNFQSVEKKFRAVRPISRLFGGKIRYADSGACAFVYKLDIAMVDLESADSYDKYNSTAEASRMNRWRLENLMSKICFVEASKLSASLPICVRAKF